MGRLYKEQQQPGLFTQPAFILITRRMTGTDAAADDYDLVMPKPWRKK